MFTVDVNTFHKYKSEKTFLFGRREKNPETLIEGVGAAVSGMDAVQKNEAEVENQLQRRVSLKYSKEKLLQIREESAISKFRPKCLQDRFDCEGVWDPERWHAAALPDSAVAMVSEDWASGPNGRPAAKRRSSDPRERLRDEVDVVLSPQRRSFGGGCHVASLSTARQVQSHPEGLSEVRASQLSNGRRVGSGRVVVRTFDREPSGRERRNRGEARRPGDRRRKDEVEPEWFSAGPISQSETIELKGFLEDERGKAGGNERGLKAASIKEKPGENGFDAVLPSEPAVPAFDLNEFLEKGLPGLAVMEEETSSKTAAFSRFSQWFRGSGGHRDGGLGIGPCDRQAVMREDPKSRGFVHAHEEKVDILDLLRKAKVDVAPILGNLVANHDYLKDSAQSGKVRSVSELEAELTTSTCLAPQASHMPSAELSAPHSAPIMVSELEQALGGQDFINPRRGPKRDGSDMSAFSRLVQSMKAGGTLPSRPVDVGASRGSIPDASMEPSQIPTNTVPQKNLLLDILGSSGEVKSPSPPIACLPDLLRVGTSSPKPSSVSLTSRLQDCTEFSGKDLLENLTSPLQGVLPMMASTPPASTSPGVDGFRKDVEEQRARIAQQSPHSPTTVAHNANSFSPNQTATTSSMLSPAFTPTSVIRKMHASRERRGSEVGNETQLAENGGEVSAKDRISASTPSSPTLIYDSFPPPLPHRPRAMHPRPSMLPVTNPQAGMALLGPPGLHPNMLQRMLATEGVRGVHPRGMPTGMFADGTAGHLLPTPHPYPINPLFTSQAMALASRLPHSSAFHFAMLQQRLNQTATSQTHFAVPGALRAARAGRGTPSVTGGSRHSPTPHPALARWFGKEILQQPLPSMPNHVISVDDLELRPGI